MSNDLISREALKKAIEEYKYCGFYDKLIELIDNAPTVEPKKEIITDCENCPFKKFSEDMADKLAKVMIDNSITDFDKFAKRCGVSYLHQDSITKSDTQI